MAKKTFEAYEDNGGYIRLYILEAGKPVLMKSGWESMESGMLGYAFDALINDIEVCIGQFEWDELSPEEIAEAYASDTDPEMIHDCGLIADESGVYNDAMGIAGGIAFYRWWYAVLMDEDDNDWGTGSHIREEAVAMAKRMGARMVASIEQGINPICSNVEEIASFSSRDVASMVEDFLADHADEYADDPIVLDGDLVYDGDCHEYVQPCHDSDNSYLLVPYMVSGGGEISIGIV